MKTIFRPIVFVVILGVGLFVGPREPIARAQAPHVIDFVVVTGTPITPAGSVDAGDTLIFTGPAKFVTSAGDCTQQPGNAPVQNAVVVDPAGGRATRVIDAIVVDDSGATPISPPPPVKPGTKLTSLITLPQCQNTAAGILYDTYRGTVQ